MRREVEAQMKDAAAEASRQKPKQDLDESLEKSQFYGSRGVSFMGLG